MVQTACKELKEEFGDNIYAKYGNTLTFATEQCRVLTSSADTAVISATNEAGTTAAKWGSPVNRENRAAGGLCWSTYKAICRRNGIYSNAQGPHVRTPYPVSAQHSIANHCYVGMERSTVRNPLRLCILC